MIIEQDRVVSFAYRSAAHWIEVLKQTEIFLRAESSISPDPVIIGSTADRGINKAPANELAANSISSSHMNPPSASLHAFSIRNVRSLDRKSTRLNSSHRCISYAV